MEQTANPGYAFGRLAKALRTAESDEPADVRLRAARKAETWKQIITGMFSGLLTIGSRTPVAGTPSWATLEVAHGGFASGELLAGGDLKPHESDLLKRVPSESGATERARLNAYFVSESGYAELVAMLASGQYRVDVPEEGALLAVAWLAENGRTADAHAVLDEITPYFDRLRFYPAPSPKSRDADGTVHLQNVGEVMRGLEAVVVSDRFVKQKESIEVWRPLYESVVGLFCETVEGELPRLRIGSDDKPAVALTGGPVVEGGWPCQNYRDDWFERARSILSRCSQQRLHHRLCKSFDARNSGFATLRKLLARCVENPKALTGREVGLIRSVLAGIITRYGGPSDSRWTELRQRQLRQLAGPTRVDLAKLLRTRLANYPTDEGLSSLDGILAAVSDDEARRHSLPAGATIPSSLLRKVERCLDAPVETLVERSIVGSAEVLARLLPQITAQVTATAFDDARLRKLYHGLYTAFRRRRSLLLLNLESQVKFAELPWVNRLLADRRGSQHVRDEAKRTLERLVVLAIKGFPQQILPNKLLQEIRALAKNAGLDLPIVDELAADIFMGEFSAKFLEAAKVAATLLERSLYEHYYGIPLSDVLRINDVKPSRYGTPTSAAFAALCTRLAGKDSASAGRSVARNGKIIEQSQILTTHNLAVLFAALELREKLGNDLADLADRSFTWICRKQRQTGGEWTVRLRRVKNAAYAWRQILFFLSLAPPGSTDSFLARAREVLAKEPAFVNARLQPVIEGLSSVMNGERHETNLSGPRRFLGWTTQKHWLLVDQHDGTEGVAESSN